MKVSNIQLPKQDELLKVLERLSVLNRDNGFNFTNTDRLDAIASLLRHSAYKKVEADGLFHLYSKKPIADISGPVIIVSSHVDCERNITKCFWSREDEYTLLGTFDNAITNASITYNMLSGSLPETVLVAFTGDEEEGGRGSRDLVRFINENHLEVLNVFVLDVTAEGWQTGADFTIENDFWDEEVGAVIVDLARKSQYKWNFVPGEPDDIPEYVPKEVIIPVEAYEDESWEYDEGDIPCFSFCLPTEGEMHADEGIYARIHSFERYTAVLHTMLTGICRETSGVSTIDDNSAHARKENHLIYEDILHHPDIVEYYKKGDAILGQLGYTDHSLAHTTVVANRAADILKAFDYDAHDIELVKIAGLMHDIGNVINRNHHAEYGALLANEILKETSLSVHDRVMISSAIANHDESTGVASDPVAAALIIADKTDVRRSRVRVKDHILFDKHDRVNYAVTDNKLVCDNEKKLIALYLTIDENISTMYEYFDIFLGRMMMCQRAARILDTQFSLVVNGRRIL